MLPSIVLIELVRLICSRRGREESRIIFTSLVKSGLRVVPVDEDIALRAGLMMCKYPSVPLGDCIIAAVAERYKARVLSDDKYFDEIEEVKRVWI